MRKLPLIAACAAAGALAAAAAPAGAAELVRSGQGMISSAVVVPAGSTTVYVSGITPSAQNADAPKGTPPVYGDTKAQTTNILTKIGDILKAQGMGLGDVVMMRVYLVGDPTKEGKMDFAGMNAAYGQFFGTPTQPNKPSRITMQITQLANPAYLVEIEVQAAKAP